MERTLLQFLYAIDEASQRYGLWILPDESDGTIGVYDEDGLLVAKSLQKDGNEYTVEQSFDKDDQ